MPCDLGLLGSQPESLLSARPGLRLSRFVCFQQVLGRLMGVTWKASGPLLWSASNQI